MIVTDTNVIGYLFLSSEESQLSELALRNVLATYMRKTIIP